MDIYDVPEHTGVSVTTVSRVLNDNPSVSEGTREKVLKITDELGYTPNVLARGLRLNTIRTIGIMYSDSSDPYLTGAIYYLERGLHSHGYDATLCCAGYDLDAKQKYSDLLRSRWANAIILTGSKFVEIRAKDSIYIIEAASDLPIMLVSGLLEGENIYDTVCDDYAAVYDAASQLLSYRHRHILYAYTSYSYSGVDKLAEYKDALKVEGITPSDGLIHQCPKDIEVARELLLSLHGKGLEFGAAVTLDDSLTADVVRHVHIVGTSTPRGLSIVDYNNPPLARCTGPEITSVDNKMEAFCTTAINTLMGAFSGVNMPSRATIASGLIRRKATNF